MENKKNEVMETQTPEKENEKPAKKAEKILGVVLSNALNVRSGPSTENDVIKVLKSGSMVEIVNEMGDWYEISIKGYPGFCMKKFIEKK